MRLKPRIMAFRADDESFQARTRTEPGSNALRNPWRGQKLVFDIDRAFCRVDTFHEKPLDLTHRLAIGISRFGARNTNGHISKIMRHGLGPRIVRNVGPWQILAGRTRPPHAHEVSEGARCLDINNHLHVVERQIRLAARVQAAGSSKWCAVVSQRLMVRSNPPLKATASSTTTSF